MHVGRTSVNGAGQFLAACAEIRNAALEGLLSAAEEIVLPLAVEKAPLLVDVERAGTGHGPHANPAKYQGGEPGELKESARIVDELEKNQRVGIAFDTPYAALQHEHMDWHHEVGEPKYLENAVNESDDAVIDHVAKNVREVTA
jgi:hypothetical protein